MELDIKKEDKIENNEANNKWNDGKGEKKKR